MRAAPVSQQPRVTLTRWSVVEVGESFHLVGWCLETQKGRVSTAITSLDPDTLKVTTASGRQYQLTHCPAAVTDADWIRALWDAAIGEQDA